MTGTGTSADRDAGVWIVGCGGVGRETCDAAATTGFRVRGYLDERRQGMVGEHGVGPLSRLSPGEGFVVAVADPAVRSRLADALSGAGGRPVTVAHARAVVASGAAVAPGCLLLCGAYVSVEASVGAHCQVQYNATIGHDTVLEEYVTVLPGANVSGSVRLERDVTIGAGAVVLQGLTVGAGAFVGAGAVVTRDVAPGDVVIGAPARPLRR